MNARSILVKSEILANSIKPWYAKKCQFHFQSLMTKMIFFNLFHFKKLIRLRNSCFSLPALSNHFIRLQVAAISRKTLLKNVTSMRQNTTIFCMQSLWNEKQFLLYLAILFTKKLYMVVVQYKFSILYLLTPCKEIIKNII